ncbi:hypothetical protein DY000_02024464 [Brassica cretica]|uniref:Alpha N-terminal protein methyltransferase 1 n=1 Tax=Brassica cretica TaxID=69181 RepID=A0ABQ7E259_BRACR|nr:hypothetical protein DY000_02024464 [Brassica cretica]
MGKRPIRIRSLPLQPPKRYLAAVDDDVCFALHRKCVRINLEESLDPMEVCGVDSEGKEFNSAKEMWREEIGEEGDETKKTQWYRDGVSYWEGVEASVDGVLGGYGHVNDADIIGSEVFLKILLQERLLNGETNQHLVALDCGSGVGRITKNLLIRYFNEVDLVEPVAQFLDAARKNLASTASETHKATNFFCVPLQGCLKPGGFFVVKENLAKQGFVLDKEDRSITRSDPYFKQLFRRCGLHLYQTKDQKGLPKELFAVKMYALTVDTPPKVHITRSKTSSNRPQIIK